MMQKMNTKKVLIRRMRKSQTTIRWFAAKEEEITILQCTRYNTSFSSQIKAKLYESRTVLNACDGANQCIKSTHIHTRTHIHTLYNSVHHIPVQLTPLTTIRSTPTHLRTTALHARTHARTHIHACIHIRMFHTHAHVHVVNKDGEGYAASSNTVAPAVSPDAVEENAHQQLQHQQHYQRYYYETVQESLQVKQRLL